MCASSWHGCISHRHARHGRTRSRCNAASSQARPLRPTDATRSSRCRTCACAFFDTRLTPFDSILARACEQPSPLACILPDGTMEDVARCARRRPKRNGTAHDSSHYEKRILPWRPGRGRPRPSTRRIQPPRPARHAGAARARMRGHGGQHHGQRKHIIVFMDGETPRAMMNPEIIAAKGIYETEEGCCSRWTAVARRTVPHDPRALPRPRLFEERTETFEGFSAQGTDPARNRPLQRRGRRRRRRGANTADSERLPPLTQKDLEWVSIPSCKGIEELIRSPLLFTCAYRLRCRLFARVQLVDDVLQVVGQRVFKLQTLARHQW